MVSGKSTKIRWKRFGSITSTKNTEGMTLCVHTFSHVFFAFFNVETIRDSCEICNFAQYIF